jgi:hypothetical protein
MEVIPPWTYVMHSTWVSTHLRAERVMRRREGGRRREKGGRREMEGRRE